MEHWLTGMHGSSVGRGWGNALTSLPPKSEKLLQKSGVIFQRYILSERKSPRNIQLKNCEKRQFSIEILIKKSQNFLEKFQDSLYFWSKRARFFKHLLSFTCPIGIIHQISIILHFSIKSNRFSPKISKICMPFSIVLYLSYFFSFFHKFLSQILEFTENFSGFIGNHNK